MLPYLQRDYSKPETRGPVKRLETEANRQDDLAPTLQKAMQEDLLTLRHDFIKALGSSSSSSISNSHSGGAFGVCKEIFRDRRIAAWHTRFLPPRSDPAAWSQMIYAACLEGLPQRMKKSNDDNGAPEKNNNTLSSETTITNGHSVSFARKLGTLTEAAFVVFCLYIFHETNPLPQGEKLKGVSLLTMLTMGLRNRENRQVLFRRAFRPFIRVDQPKFASLLYWREQARAISADISSTSTDGLLAEDFLVVLERLWDQLDFVSYTGPRGVDGMAGHPDYPYGKNKDERTNPSSPSSTAVDAQRVDDQTGSMLELEKSVESYLASCRSIKLPPPVDDRHRRRLEKVRNALKPIFHDTPGSSIESILSKMRDKQSATTVLQSKPRMVTFSVVESAVSPTKEGVGEEDGGASIGRQDPTKEKQQGNEHESYELVLPLNTPASLRRSLEDAVHKMLESDSMALVGPVLPAVSIPEGGLEDDGVSTLAPPHSLASQQIDDESMPPPASRGRPRKLKATPNGALSDAQSHDSVESRQSGAGRNALKSLLDRGRNDAGTDASVASLQTGAGREALESLLAQVNVASKKKKSGQSGTSDKASITSVQTEAGRQAREALLAQVAAASESQNQGQRGATDDVSLASAATGVGRQALESLLERARVETGSDTADVASVVTALSGAGQEALMSLLDQVDVSPKKRAHTASASKPRGRGNHGTRNNNKAGPSNASVQSGVGRGALQALLASADDKLHTSRRPARSHIGRGMEFLFDENKSVAKSDHSEVEVDDLSDVSDAEEDDFSVAMSSMGRHAIQELIDSAESGKRKPAPQKKKGPLKASTKRKKREPSDTKSPRGKRKKSSPQESDSHTEERSTAGKDALNALLSNAAPGDK